MLICPVCQNELKKEGKTYVCINGHSFDMAKEGYVNLLLSNQKRSKEPGDSKESLRNRDNFLNSGTYQFLSDELNLLSDKYYPFSCDILDAGCGSGYYLSNLASHREYKDNYYGIDIGKEEVRMTAKKVRALLSVASVFRLPFSDNSFDLIMSVFTPYSAEEFYRAAKENGIVISVQPGKRHLYELKEIIYDNPYENADKGYDLEGFESVESKTIEKVSKLDNSLIKALWEMTPYAHKTSRDGNAKLDSIGKLDVTISFFINVYRRK